MQRVFRELLSRTTRLHGITPQKTVVFISTAPRNITLQNVTNITQITFASSSPLFSIKYNRNDPETKERRCPVITIWVDIIIQETSSHVTHWVQISCWAREGLFLMIHHQTARTITYTSAVWTLTLINKKLNAWTHQQTPWNRAPPEKLKSFRNSINSVCITEP
jgi:hypothetical protein